MEINNIDIVHFLKKVIDDADVKVFEKYINFIKKNESEFDFNEIEIESLSVVQYITKNSNSKLLNILSKNDFDLNNSFNDDLPSIISARNNDISSVNVFLNNNKALLENGKTSILIELAKNNSIRYINKIISNNRVKRLLKFEDENSNNLLFYINDLNTIKKAILIDKNILWTRNWNNDDVPLHFAKSNNYDVVKFFVKNNLYKINNINYQDCNIVHYILKNKWFDLIENIDLRKIKKEYNICNINGNDLFLELLLNSNDEQFKKYNKVFFNKMLVNYYIEKVSLYNNEIIKKFIDNNINYLSDENIINFFVSLLQEKNEIIAIELIEKIQSEKSKNFINLLKGILDKYINHYLSIYELSGHKK